MTDLFQNKYRIESTRLKSIDYNNGYFFVTFCTKDREHTLGEISDGRIILSAIGEFASKTITEIQNHHPYCSVESFVIMPNHIHVIFYVAHNTNELNTDVQHTSDNDLNVNHQMQMTSKRKGRLSIVVGSLKSVIKKFATDNDVPFEWQTRFHDHFIRNTEEMAAIKTYIENNIGTWQGDEFYD